MQQIFDPFGYRNLFNVKDRIGQGVEVMITAAAAVSSQIPLVAAVSYEAVRLVQRTVINPYGIDEFYLFY